MSYICKVKCAQIVHERILILLMTHVRAIDLYFTFEIEMTKA